jgi:hypothetical protein
MMLHLIATSLLVVSVTAVAAEEPARRSPDAAPPSRAIEYSAEALRDPLKSLLPPPPPQAAQAVKPVEVPVTAPDASLQGMLWGGGQPRAIINGEVYRVGDSVVGSKIVSIDHQGVTVDISGHRFVLTPSSAAPRRPGQRPTAAARPPAPRGGNGRGGR